MITVTDLKKVYHQGRREIRALDGVTLTVDANSVHVPFARLGPGQMMTNTRNLSIGSAPSTETVTFSFGFRSLGRRRRP